MSREGRGPLLLDTHVWIWYVENVPERLTRRTQPLIEAAVSRGDLLISAISVWEVAMLVASRRIELAQDVRAWAGRALAFPGVRVTSLTPAIAIESTRLPGALHRDPADRMLVATARLLGATFVTCDERLLDYAKLGHLGVVDARP